MRHRNSLFPAAVLAFITLPYAAHAFQSSRNDATSHQPATSKTSPPAKRAEPIADHVVYPKAALTKVEILPSSIELVGARYGQRLIVEGTFADGHQEDLTSEAKIISSDSNIAVVDKSEFGGTASQRSCNSGGNRAGPPRKSRLSM